MKPFDLEKAKAGHPIVTRQGHKARILCFDRVSQYPIVALISTTSTVPDERIVTYTINGKTVNNTIGPCDLFMEEINVEKWVITLRTRTGELKTYYKVFNIEEDAQFISDELQHLVGIHKIEISE